MTRWPIDRLPRRAAPRDRRPFVLATAVGGQRLVSAVDSQAATEGIVPGMTLADARALHPALAVAAADFAGDAAALAALAQWCGRYSPWTAPCGPDAIWLDVTGCAHLHGGEAAMAAEIVARLAHRGITARAVIAGSAGAAWALAHHGDAKVAVVPAGGERAALAALPVAALRLSPELAATLMRLGLRRIGDLYPMARPSLVLRFGTGLAARLDQALGLATEPLSPLRPPPCHWTRRRFAEPLATADVIVAAVQGLIEALCRHLAAAAEGVRRLVLTLYRVDGTPVAAEICTARPSRDPGHLLHLIAARLEAVDPGLGIEDMVLAATATEPLGSTQLALDRGGGAAESDDGLAALVDRLVAQLGAAAVSRPVLRESHWPERAVRFAAPLEATAGAAVMAGRQRPVRLLPRPEPVEAVAPVPDDPPLLFRWRAATHRVRRAEGPERIVGEWWCYSNELRDYYRVEDETGRRFWLYRAGRYDAAVPAAWFLHGFFA